MSHALKVAMIGIHEDFTDAQMMALVSQLRSHGWDVDFIRTPQQWSASYQVVMCCHFDPNAIPLMPWKSTRQQSHTPWIALTRGELPKSWSGFKFDEVYNFTQESERRSLMEYLMSDSQTRRADVSKLDSLGEVQAGPPLGGDDPFGIWSAQSVKDFGDELSVSSFERSDPLAVSSADATIDDSAGANEAVQASLVEQLYSQSPLSTSLSSMTAGEIEVDSSIESHRKKSSSETETRIGSGPRRPTLDSSLAQDGLAQESEIEVGAQLSSSVSQIELESILDTEGAASAQPSPHITPQDHWHSLELSVGKLEVESKAQTSTRQELERIRDLFLKSQEERQALVARVRDLESSLTASEHERDVLRGKMSQAEDDFMSEMRGQHVKMDQLSYKARRAEEKFNELQQRIKDDIVKIRFRERELANKLDLQRRDAEALLRGKDKQLLDQRREIELLQHELDLRKERMIEIQRDNEDRTARLMRVLETLKMSTSVLEDFKTEDAPVHISEERHDNVGHSKSEHKGRTGGSGDGEAA